MMRRSGIGFVLCALMGVGAMAEDAERPLPLRQKTNAPELKWGFSVDAAQATFGFQGDGAKTGFGFGGSCILDFGWGQAIRVRTNYTEFNSTANKAGLGSVDSKKGIFAIGAEYYYQFTNNASFGRHDLTQGTYVFGGGAIDYVNSRDTIAGTTSSSNGTKFEFSGGVGYQFNPSFCLEARYRHIPTNDTALSFVQGSAILRF